MRTLMLQLPTGLISPSTSFRESNTYEQLHNKSFNILFFEFREYGQVVKHLSGSSLLQGEFDDEKLLMVSKAVLTF